VKVNNHAIVYCVTNELLCVYSNVPSQISLPMCEIRLGQGGTESFLAQLLLFPLPVIVLPLFHYNTSRCSGTDPTARSQILSLQDACFLSDQHFAEPRITTPHHNGYMCLGPRLIVWYDLSDGEGI